MHKTPSQTRAFAEELKRALPRTKRCSVILCVPFVSIPIAIKTLKDCRVAIAAQNVHWETSGAYTGEVSAEMLVDLGVKYVLIGHSERRQYFAETDPIVNKKIHAALEADLRPILCVGETEEQHKLGLTSSLLTYQIKAALSGVTADQIRHVTIAYEPIWAIGTGNTATPEQAGEACQVIRSVLRSMYGARVARRTTIQYGGSMNPQNAEKLLAQTDVDGGLIGGASLNCDDLLNIVYTANEYAENEE